MTKTQQILLSELAERGRTYVEVARGRGPGGGLIDIGSRRFDAALALVQQGLARREGSHNHTIYRRGYAVRVASFVLIPA